MCVWAFRIVMLKLRNSQWLIVFAVVCLRLLSVLGFIHDVTQPAVALSYSFTHQSQRQHNFRMKHLTFLLSIFHVMTWVPSIATIKVKQCNKVCNCSSNNIITCSSGVEILFIDKTDLRIGCQNPHANLSSVFNGLKIHATRFDLVEIHRCALPNSSLSDLLGSFGVTDFPWLQINLLSGRLQRKHFENLDKVHKLSILSSDLGVLPVDTFEGLTNLDYLIIDYFKLTKDMFVLNTKLSVITLVINNISEVSFDVFHNFSGLRSVTIKGAKQHDDIFLKSNQYIAPAVAEFVPEDAFSKSINIKSVRINNHNINTVYENTFSDLESLTYLDLSKNRISHLPEGLFSKTKKLIKLDVSYNLLKHIEPNLLSHLTKLESLNLSHNTIILISGEQFFQLHNVKSIDLSHNQLISLALDPLLRDLDYSVFYNCKKLDILFLQHNSLKEIYEDWLLRPYYKINLASNNITDLQIFQSKYDMISTAETSLRKIIRGGIYEYRYVNLLKKFYLIDISNNTLNCNCDLLTFMNDFFRNLTELIQHAFFQVKCREPEVFQDVKMIELNLTTEYKKCKQLPSDENQKFHQGCPKGCICVYRPLTKSSVINCQNVGLQDYPRTLPVAPGADHTELTLYGNRLREFSLPDVPGYKNVTFLNLANNLLSTLDINGVSKKLKKLDLSHNQLKTLSVETLELLEEALELERLELHNNSWSCDISNYRLAQLVYDKQKLIWHKVHCADGSPIVKIIDLFEPYLRQIVTYVLVILLMTVFILILLYYRHRQKVYIYCFSSRWKVLRWLVSHPDYDDDDKLYDAFIIYSQEDEMFVVNHLVPYLEDTEDRKYKLCLHFRDWIPGEQILTQIGRSVRSSRRAIVVLSPNFLRSVWGVAEFRVAHAEALKDGTARVIVILYQDVSDDEVDEKLKAYLQTNTYVRWGSPWFWKQLTYALPHPLGRERAALHYFSRGRRCQED